MKRVERLQKYSMENHFDEALGNAFYEAFMEDDNTFYEIGRSMIRVFDMCETERDVEFADRMLIAVCGYGIKTLMNRIAGEDTKKNYNYGDETNALTYMADWWKEHYKKVN